MITVTDKEKLIEYSKDAANILGSADKLYFPENEDDVIEILKKSYNDNIQVTFNASRTSLTGASVPKKGIIISTERLNKIIHINKDEKHVILEPGVKLATLQEELENNNLFYPPNPTEIWSTIGGNVATNASGSKTFKYGSTRDYVLGLEVLLSDGDKISIERGANFAKDGQIQFYTLKNKKIVLKTYNSNREKLEKNSTGYPLGNNIDLIDLFIGSEGTLGFISKIKLKLLDIPQVVFSTFTFFDNTDSLLEFVRLIRDKKENYRLAEFFDSKSLDLLKKYNQNIPDNTIGAIWNEIECNEDNFEEILNKHNDLISSFTTLSDLTWFASDSKSLREFTEFRHKLPLEVNELLTKYKRKKIYTDTSVPNNKFNEYFKQMYKELDKTGVDYVVFGHIGNSHLHANLFASNNKEQILSEKFYNNIVKKAIKLGGTFSSEHGVGKLKTKYMNIMYSKEELNYMKYIKNILDPKAILNSGNILN